MSMIEACMMPSFATSAGCRAAQFADVGSASGLFLIFAAELAADYSRHRPQRSPHSAGPPARAASSAVIHVTLRRETTPRLSCPVARARPSALGFAGQVWTPGRTGVQI